MAQWPYFAQASDGNESSSPQVAVQEDRVQAEVVYQAFVSGEWRVYGRRLSGAGVPQCSDVEIGREDGALVADFAATPLTGTVPLRAPTPRARCTPTMPSNRRLHGNRLAKGTAGQVSTYAYDAATGLS